MIAFSNSEALFLTSPTGAGLRPYPGRDSRQRPVYLLYPLGGEPALLFIPKYRQLYRPSLEPTNFSETSLISSPSTLSPSLATRIPAGSIPALWRARRSEGPRRRFGHPLCSSWSLILVWTRWKTPRASPRSFRGSEIRVPLVAQGVEHPAYSGVGHFSVSVASRST